MNTNNESPNPSPNYWTRFDGQAPTSSEIMRLTAHLMPPVSPDAYNLSNYLASWWNDSNGNVIIFPSEFRVCSALNMTGDRFRAALVELEGIEWWKPVWKDNGAIKEYKPLFAFSHGLLEQAQHHAGFSLNHGKIIVRYVRASNPATISLLLWVVAHTRQLPNSLGYKHWLPYGEGKKAKLFHGTFFTHAYLQEQSDEAWERLAAHRKLPEEWTLDEPHWCLVSLAEVQKRINMTAEQFEAACEEIETLGFWTVRREGIDPFAQTFLATPGMDSAVLTPTYLLHSLAWEFDHQAGGKAISDWERLNNFGDKDGRELPPLGYHFIYALRSRLSCGAVIVGQTTQSLDTRLAQHLRLATNGDANNAVRKILRNPNDTLDIEHLATVFHPTVAQYEMDTANAFLASGEPLQNKILTVRENRRTVKPDSRFEGLQWRDWRAFDERMEAILAEHDGQEILWERPTEAEQGEAA